MKQSRMSTKRNRLEFIYFFSLIFIDRQWSQFVIAGRMYEPIELWLSDEFFHWSQPNSNVWSSAAKRSFFIKS